MVKLRDLCTNHIAQIDVVETTFISLEFDISEFYSFLLVIFPEKIFHVISNSKSNVKTMLQRIQRGPLTRTKRESIIKEGGAIDKRITQATYTRFSKLISCDITICRHQHDISFYLAIKL